VSPRISEQAKQARRDQILSGARNAFAEHGYEGATVAKLEQACGLSRGAIFNYYASKDELFYALAQRDAARFGTLWAETGFGGLLRALYDEDPAWLGVYFEVFRKLRTDDDFRRRWAERSPDTDRALEERLRELQDAGALRADVPLETIGLFMSIVIDGVIARHATGFPTSDVEGLIRLAEDAIAPERAPRRTPARTPREAA
jgi:TetR/AcrR family transcriptional regulator, transcriptional repressor of aconitase